MPALVSHHRFAASALAQAQPYLANAAAAAPMAFRWGAQGPDILYYYQPLYENHICRTGHRIHNERAARMFSALTADCARQNTPEATAYLLGFCCHYILDRSAHPFVTYMANYRLDPLYPWMSHTALHNLCEAELDRALIERIHPGGSADFRAYVLLSCDAKCLNAIAPLLSHAVWNVYGTRVTPKTVKSCMRSMLRMQRMLHDKSGRRTAAVSWLETRLGSPGAVSSLMRPTHPLDADCLNLDHRAWIDAATPHMRCYTDYFQIFDRSQRFAAQLMDVCYDAVQTGAPLPEELVQLSFMGLPER